MVDKGKIYRGYDRLEEFFRSFVYTAFRLEVRPSYGMGEAEHFHFREFLNGESPPADWMQPWFDVIEPRLKEGRSMQRVRIADVPPSDYLRFEMRMTPHNTAHGEEIRYLDRDAADALGLPTRDYWLFDSSAVASMIFNDEDALVAIEVDDDPGLVLRHVQWREAALHHALKVDEYCSTR